MTFCGTITEDQDNEDIYTFGCTGRGDVVELRKDGVVGIQNIAEIEVFRIIYARGYDI